MHTVIASIRPLLAILLLGASSAPLAAQHFHHLPATPRTVAYGYYSAAATPVLRIASGDTVEVETLSTHRTRIIPLDRARMTAQFAPDIVIPLHPFFGSMGVAPPRDSGRVSSNPPGIHAGNMDNKELVAGTTLFIPVHASGALFEIGDGHAAQGDGEVDQTAIETSLTGRLQLVVRRDMHLTWPRAETPTHFIAMGMDKDLTRATEIAVQNAIDFVAAYRGWSQMEAYRLVSVACDVRVTELVDGNVGVHVMIPKSIVGK